MKFNPHIYRAILFFIVISFLLSFDNGQQSELKHLQKLEQLYQLKNHEEISIELARFKHQYGCPPKLKAFQLKWYKELMQNVFDSSYFETKQVAYLKDPNRRSCYEGQLSSRDKQEFLRNLNFVRMLAGLGNVQGLDSKSSINCQKAAWCLTVNNTITHSIPRSFKCYSSGAVLAAKKSNLSIGYQPGHALFGMLRDEEKSNYSVGHRRWLLNPSLQRPGYGLTDKVAVVQVIGKEVNATLDQQSIDEYETRPITWPVSGIHPTFLATTRFSFSLASASFKNCSIEVYKNGKRVKASKLKLAPYFANATVVFDLTERPRSNDLYRIYLKNVVKKDGAKKNYTYEVKFRDL